MIRVPALAGIVANSPGVDMANARYPRKDPDARTGSSLRGQPLQAFHQAHQAAPARATKLHERLAKEHRRQSRRLFSKADLRRAAEIGRQVNRDWREASVKAGGDSMKVDALKLSARKKLERRLAREFPNYRQWKTLRKANLREHDKLRTTTLAAHRARGARLVWGDLGAIGAPTTFAAPFTTFDVQLIEQGNFVVFDESFARPTIGHLVNNFAYDQDQSGSFGFASLFGLHPIASAVSLVSCGVSFTTPAAGRLRIGASLLNIYNKVVVSVEDKFGFSSAHVSVSLDLFVASVRGTVVELKTQRLPGTELFSDGDDKRYIQADLDTTMPYGMTAVMDARLEANESVLVLAGSSVTIGTVLDDMHCKMNAVLWWKLNSLSIEMVAG
jgi:hypothetical protein